MEQAIGLFLNDSIVTRFYDPYQRFYFWVLERLAENTFQIPFKTSGELLTYFFLRFYKRSDTELIRAPF